MRPLSIYSEDFGEGCLGWTLDDHKRLLELREGFVYIPDTGDLKFIPVLRQTNLELIKVPDPQKSWEKYSKNYNPIKVNKDRLEFIKKERGLYYNNLGIHPLACINEEGMGYEWDNGWLEFPQRGGVKIGKDVRVGAFTSIKKGTKEDTIIGDGCKIGSHCNIGHNVKLGNHCLIAPHTTIGGSTEIGSRVVIWQGVRIAHKLKIGNNVEIGMGSVVLADVPDNTKVKGLWK